MLKYVDKHGKLGDWVYILLWLILQKSNKTNRSLSAWEHDLYSLKHFE